MSFSRGALLTVLLPAVMLVASPVTAMPVVLDFNAMPPAPWSTNTCDGLDQVSVNAGVLTIDSPSCYEIRLVDPVGEWNQKVDNAKGWAVEARVRVDASSDDNPEGIVEMWIHDHTNLIIVGLTKGQVQIQYPDFVGAAQDTTDAFHVYRVVSALNKVRVYVDGALRINHTLMQPGAGTDQLSFGDGNGGDHSLSYWDYFWYDVDCLGGICDPGVCVDGTPCDDSDACTESDTCTSGACSGINVLCQAIDECHFTGKCDPVSGCPQSAVPDGTPCSLGTCVGGACILDSSTASVASAASSAASTAASTGSGAGIGGAGGAAPEVTPIYGRASCFCEVGSAGDGRPAWLGLAALLLLGRRRRTRGR